MPDPTYKKTILIVEDEDTFSRPLSAQLTNEGYTVLLAHDGVEGLDIAHQQHPDLILLDLKMPNMDGMTMLRKLRTFDFGKTIPVLILTVLSIDDEARIRNVAELTPAYYLEKGDTPLVEVVEKVREILGSPRE